MKTEWMSADKKLCVKREDGDRPYRQLFYNNKEIASQYRIKGEARAWAKSKVKQQLRATARWLEKTEDEVVSIRKEFAVWTASYQTLFN